MAAHNNAMMQLLEKIERFFPEPGGDMPTLQDLKNPTSSMVVKFLGRAFYEFNVEFDTLRMAQYSQSLCSNYPESYAEIIPYINVYEIYSRLFQMGDINVDFSMRDILQPKPQQNVKVMNAVMDFLIFADKKVMEIEPTFEEIRREKQQVANRAQAMHMYREKINELMNANAALDKKIRERKEDLVKVLKTDQETKKKELENTKKMKVAKLKETEAKLARATVTMQELNEERDKLNSLIVDSPMKIKSDIENQRRKRVESSKKLDDLRDNIAQLKAQNNHLASVLEMLEQWSKKMQRAQELTKIIGDLEAKLKEDCSHLEAREKSYKELEKRHLSTVKKLEMAETKERKMCDELEAKMQSLKLTEKKKKEYLESQIKSLKESSKTYSTLVAEVESIEEESNVSSVQFNELMKILHYKCEEIIEKDKNFCSQYTEASEDRIAELRNILQKSKLFTPAKKNVEGDK